MQRAENAESLATVGTYDRGETKDQFCSLTKEVIKVLEDCNDTSKSMRQNASAFLHEHRQLEEEYELLHAKAKWLLSKCPLELAMDSTAATKLDGGVQQSKNDNKSVLATAVAEASEVFPKIASEAHEACERVSETTEMIMESLGKATASVHTSLQDPATAFGVFLESAMKASKNDDSECMHEHLRDEESALRKIHELFEEVDEDASGCISFQIFSGRLQDPRMRANLTKIGIEVNEAEGLFQLLDMDGSGSITIDEFLYGCMRMKGAANAVDMQTLLYENKKVFAKLNAFAAILDRNFNMLQRMSHVIDMSSASRMIDL